jgi:hypothetical protein
MPIGVLTEDKSPTGKFVVGELFLLSFASLLLELLIIRWLGCEIRAFAIYKNFPLIACFVGLGYGFVRARSSSNLFRLFPALLLTLVALIATSDLTHLSQMMIMSVRSDISFTWPQMLSPPEYVTRNPGEFIMLSVIGFSLLMAVTAWTFACLGEQIGRLFNQLPPLHAYLINILGSTAGIALFSMLSFLCTPPPVWLICAVLPCLWVFRQRKISLLLLCLTVALPIVSSRTPPDTTTVWSPYYRVSYGPLLLPGAVPPREVGYGVSVNKGFLLQALNCGNEFRRSLGKTEIDQIALDYEVPYLLTKAESVLVLGAGAGNDTAAALRKNVARVDGVEIDPVVVSIGRQFHPEQPYSSPKVRIITNDARAFLRQSNDKYDLVSTGILDSHTAVGNSQSVRLDEYVYTAEGLTDLLRHMKQGGMLSLAYSYPSVSIWIGKRIVNNLRLALERSNLPPDMLIFKNKKTKVWHFIAPVTPELRAKVAELCKTPDFEDLSNLDTAGVRPSTDDWPYLYLAPNTFDSLYVMVNALILITSWLFCGKYIVQYASLRRWHLFCLGAGFLLMELAIIDRLALIFGSTWIVNSIGIFSIMIAIFLSNLLVLRKPDLLTIARAYPALVAFLLLDYVLPLEQLALQLGLGGRVLAVVLFAVPIFFAGIIFSQIFSKEEEPSVGLAFNIFGAMIGGLLEYAATYTGIRSLVLIGATFYVIGWLTTRQSAKSK